MKQLVDLSEAKGYNHFHPQWFENNKLSPETWLLEMTLLQKWLRELYNIHCSSAVFKDEDGGKYRYEAVVLSALRETEDEYRLPENCFDDYEYALHNSLMDGLNLLPNKQ